MFGVLFLVLATWAGFVLTKKYLPDLLAAQGYPSIMTALPAAFTTGVIASGLLTYILSLIFAHTGQGILYGSALTGATLIAFSALTWKQTMPCGKMPRAGALCGTMLKGIRSYPALFSFLLLLAVFLGWVFRHSFFYEDGSLFAGYSVFSDFGPHVAIVRSFSVGNNFPAQYPHFPDGTMLYHFMFQFYTGILESLGMRIDHALNSLSLISLMGCLSLLYALTVKITKKPAAGILVIVLFIFRSSLSAFTFLFDGTEYDSVMAFFERIRDNKVFIGNTPNENWGLWNINVYANQRHLGFGLSLVFMLIIAFLPLYMGGRIDRLGAKSVNGARTAKGAKIAEGARNTEGAKTAEGAIGVNTAENESGGGPAEEAEFKWFSAFFKAESWRPNDVKRYIYLGLLAGAAAYFHGSCLVAALGILAVIAVFSKEKLGFALFAAIALALTVAQNNFFSADAPGIMPGFQFGFIALDKSAPGVAKYLFELTGIVFPIAIAGAALRWKSYGGLFIAFLVPAVFTFTLSLTPDITVNHKYLMISLALLNIFAAYAVVRIAESFAERKSKILRTAGAATAVALVLVLTISGILDIVPYRHQSGPDSRAVYSDTASETVGWIKENTEKGSVFLSHWHVQSPILMAGRFEYLGWPYYGWSAGYDTDGRADEVIGIFSSRDEDELRARALASGASYIFVDWDLIDNHEFGFNEDIVAAAFPLVFRSDAEGVRIYEVW